MHIRKTFIPPALLAVVLLIGAIFMLPAPAVPSIPITPALNYAQAISAIKADIAGVDFDRIQSQCSPLIFDHGEKTKKAVLIFHGYTNCPKQFEPFAKELFDQGYNVYVPLLPEHGLKENYQDELHTLTAEQLTTFADTQTARALGLGDSLTVLGLSAGANLALWEAQHDARITRSVAIAPVVYPYGIAPSLRDAVANFFHLSPAYFTWWSEVAKEKLVGAPYAYKKHSSKADGEILRVGLTYEKNLTKNVLVRPVMIVGNEDDEAVSFSGLKTLASESEKVQPTSSLVVFPGRGLPHDVIDVNNNSRTEEVYSFLIQKLGEFKD